MKALELKLLQAFKNLQDVLPSLSKLSFEIHKFESSNEPKISGFYHHGNNCLQYETIDELIRILILFRKFK